MSYETIFTRYGSPSDEGRIQITGYLTHPRKLTDERYIKLSDESAARIIKEAKAAIEALTDYRKALATRYAELTTMPYTLRLELERRREGYRDPRVFYHIRIVRNYEDGTKINELTEKYKGQQRREALARYEELKKQRPGIEAVKDIEKSPWER